LGIVVVLSELTTKSNLGVQLVIMKRLVNYAFSLLIIVLLNACTDAIDPNYPELGWDDLKPQEEITDSNISRFGSLEIIDDLYMDEYTASGGLTGGYAIPPTSSSSGVIAEVDGTSARLPGFVVPVEFDGENSVTEFFLVPYFGACYHNPPPPPNQTIYVTSKKPIEFESIYDPVWIMGVISTKQVGNSLATAAYSMDLHKLAPYEE